MWAPSTSVRHAQLPRLDFGSAWGDYHSIVILLQCTEMSLCEFKGWSGIGEKKERCD